MSMSHMICHLFSEKPFMKPRFFQRPVQAVNLLIQSFVKDGHFVLMTSRCSGGSMDDMTCDVP